MLSIPMLSTPVLLLLAKATLVLVAALGITRVLQHAAAGARHLVWLVTLAALLLVPALAAWAPLRLAFLPAAPTTAIAPTAWPAPAPAARPAADVAVAPPSLAAEAPRALAGDAAPSIGRRVLDAVPAALALWAAVALAIGAVLAKAWLVVRRIVRRARPLTSPDWCDPLFEIADRLGLAEVPRLMRSEDAKMPFACGIRAPTIVLPAESDGWTLDRRRAVLLHELAHVRRRDLAGHTLARLVCAVYWFHPLVWTAAKRLRAESERACDDLALTCGARATDYAEHLLEIVTSVRRDTTPVVALAMARRTEFEGRMLDILDPERRRATPGRWQSLSLVAVLALITFVVGAAAPVPAPAAEPAPRPRAADRAGAESPGTPREEQPADPADAITRSVTRDVTRQVHRAVVRTVVDGVGEVAAEAAAQATVGTAATARPNDGVAILRGIVSHAPASAQQQSERAELLAKVLRTDTSASLRRIAAWGLAEYADQSSSAAAALAQAVRDDRSPVVREMAAWALAEGRGAVARDALAAALRDADVKVRATAAWSLGSMGDRSATDALAAAAGDAAPEVRARAAWAIGSVEPRQAPRALVALLGDREPRVRELAAWALFNIEDPSAVPALQAALRAESDKDLQVAYVRALAALGEKSVDALRDLLESSDPRIRAMAVRALAGGNATGPWPRPWPQPRPFP